MRRLPTAPVAAASLPAGFGVAAATGVRPLGGALLVAAAAWCFVRWRAEAGTGRAVLLLAVYWTGFALSHALAGLVGAWAAVSIVAAVAGGAAWRLADRVAPEADASPAPA
jgi:hypothetical protein